MKEFEVKFKVKKEGRDVIARFKVRAKGLTKADAILAAYGKAQKLHDNPSFISCKSELDNICSILGLKL